MTVQSSSRRAILICGVGLLGAAVARACASDFDILVLVDSSANALEKLSRSDDFANNEVITSCMDISGVESGEGIVDLIPLDSLLVAAINCTYPYVNKSKPESHENLVHPDKFAESITCHLDNYYTFLYLANNIVSDQGSVLSFSSMYGSSIPKFEIYEDTDMNTPPDYVAAKSALIMLSKYFAKINRRRGLRFNTISPGGVFDFQDAKFVSEYTKYTLRAQMLEQSDILELVRYLVSDRSRMMTGMDILIDGGFSL